jgi:putative toxin-antitoxin system antitoxin component (TIGR02293 family)
VPERPFARRKLVEKFSPEESEKLLRLSNVFEKAVRLFDRNVEAAVAWLRSPKRALGYKAPLTYAGEGARRYGGRWSSKGIAVVFYEADFLQGQTP